MNEAILDKIRKLKTKAEGTSNEAEAEIFNQKVQELMHRHNITSLGFKTDRHGKRVSSIYSEPWRRSLAFACAESNFCKVIIIHTHRPNGAPYNHIEMLGSEANTEAAVALYDTMERTVLNMAKVYSPVRRHRLSYEKGMGIRLAQRIVTRHEAAMAQPAPEKGGLPAVVDQEQHLNAQYVEQMKMGKFKGGKTKTADHHTTRGYQDGDRINMEDQIS